VIATRGDTFPDRNNERDRLMVAQIILKVREQSQILYITIICIEDLMWLGCRYVKCYETVACRQKVV
jgi:hypothetical protein